MELVVYIARIAQSLYHVIFQSPEQVRPACSIPPSPPQSSKFFSQVDDIHVAHLEDIVNYMVPYFPVLSWDSRVCPLQYFLLLGLFYHLTYRWRS